jgi:hypothetical protein
MSLDQVRCTMDGYFNAMGGGDDFSKFYTANVRRIMIDSAQQVHGPLQSATISSRSMAKCSGIDSDSSWWRTHTHTSKVIASISLT